MKQIGDLAKKVFPRGDQLVRSADERYELEKRQWASAHPEATPAEYSAAMRRIAEECGV